MTKWNKEELENLILVENKSYLEIGRMFNLSATYIIKVAKRLGIDLPHRRKINSNEHFNRGYTKFQKLICPICEKEFIKYQGKRSFFCSQECYNIDKHHKNYENFLKGGEQYQKANCSLKHFKNDFLKEQNGKCAICECSPTHNDKPLVFILDHIDGNAANNKRENLRLVCPNCDTQLPTFKSKNKNGARHYYRYKKEKL